MRSKKFLAARADEIREVTKRFGADLPPRPGDLWSVRWFISPVCSLGAVHACAYVTDGDRLGTGSVVFNEEHWWLRETRDKATVDDLVASRLYDALAKSLKTLGIRI